MVKGNHGRARPAPRASSARSRAVVEDQGEIINRFKPDGTITFVNEVFCRFFGRKRGEMLGKRWQTLAPPEEVARIEAQLRTLSPATPAVLVENPVVGADGRTHWMEFVNRGFFDARGRLFEIQSLGRDITERKLAEQRLHEALELNRTLIAASTVGIAAFTADGRCVLANDAHARIIGACFLGRNFFELESWRKQGILKVATEVLHTRKPQHLEFRGVTSFGREICVHKHFTTFVSNGTLHLLVLISDTTERSRLEQQILEISDREQARIGQDLHDGLCQQLVSLAFDANALRQRLSRARRPEAAVARRFAKLLDGAITEARQLSRGLFPIRLAPGGLAPALEELARATSRRFGLKCDFKHSGQLILIDKTVSTHLYRIAQEAVSNAAHHAAPRRIRLRLAMRASGLELSIADDGSGLGERAADRRSGMGLHIMEYRARSIGATLRLAASQPRGTVVSCVVPARG